MFPNFSFHHVGIACRDLDLDERAFLALGYVRERECVDPIQGVRARFLVGPGGRVELVRDLDEEDGLVSKLTHKGVKMYHFAYEVDDLVEAMRRLAESGAREVVAPVLGSAFGMRLLCFYMLPNMVLVELISRT